MVLMSEDGLHGLVTTQLSLGMNDLVVTLILTAQKKFVVFLRNFPLA